MIMMTMTTMMMDLIIVDVYVDQATCFRSGSAVYLIEKYRMRQKSRPLMRKISTNDRDTSRRYLISGSLFLKLVNIYCYRPWLPAVAVVFAIAAAAAVVSFFVLICFIIFFSLRVWPKRC